MTDILTEILQDYNDKDKCKIRDPVKVDLLLREMIKDGSRKLQVITDFDFTLTRYHKDGKKCATAQGMIDNSLLMPDVYREKAEALFKKFYPIEVDHEMTPEEKTPHIIEWFVASQALLIEYQITRDMVREIIKTGNALMRDSAIEVLSLWNVNDVPCLIFSAGKGDVVEEVLRRENAFFPNIKVVSNFMEFDESGKCVAFKKPLIHIFNKNESALDNPKYFEELSRRNNVLLLGDSLGDLQMANGLPNQGSILKIGFLNDKIPQLLDSFMDNYDIVLVDDQSFKLAEIIMQKMLSLEKNGSTKNS